MRMRLHIKRMCGVVMNGVNKEKKLSEQAKKELDTIIVNARKRIDSVVSDAVQSLQTERDRFMDQMRSNLLEG